MHPLPILGWFIEKTRIIAFLSDETVVRLHYRIYIKKSLDLKNPTSFNAKIQWLKLYDRNSTYVKMADMVAVRDHIARTVGSEYLIPIIGVWKDVKQIKLDDLPDQFVLKCNHDSGGVNI